MGILDNIENDKTIKPQSDAMQSGFGTLESGIYDFTIEMMYVDETKNGAAAVHFDFVSQKGERFSTIQYITGGKAKKQRNYYMDKNDEKQYLPGFNLVNNLCIMSEGTPVLDQETVIKTLELYDYTAREKIPQKKEVFESMRGQAITIGVIKQTVNKSKADGNGGWIKTAETKDENVIGKVFQAETGLIMDEITAGTTEAITKGKWDAQNTGKTKDKTEAVKAGGASSKPKAKPPVKPAAGDVDDLFDEDE